MFYPTEYDYKKYFDEIAKKEGSERAACDFISGMTDAYSIKTFTDLFVPKTWSV